MAGSTGAVVDTAGVVVPSSIALSSSSRLARAEGGVAGGGRRSMAKKAGGNGASGEDIAWSVDGGYTSVGREGVCTIVRIVGPSYRRTLDVGINSAWRYWAVWHCLSQPHPPAPPVSAQKHVCLRPTAHLKTSLPTLSSAGGGSFGEVPSPCMHRRSCGSSSPHHHAFWTCQCRACCYFPMGKGLPSQFASHR